MIKTMEPWELMSVVMRARDEDISEMALVDGLDRQKWACKMALESGLFFTVTDRGGKPVACVGFTDDGNGIGNAWMVTTPEWCRHVKSVVKIWRTVRDKAGYRRIQSMVTPGRPGARRFLIWCGFRFDGELLKMRSDGGAMELYSYT